MALLSGRDGDSRALSEAPRILFQTYGRRGLGHLVRASNIARAIENECSGATIGFHTRGEAPAGFLEQRWQQFADTAKSPLSWMEAVTRFRPDRVVFDTVYKPGDECWSPPGAARILVLRRSKPERQAEIVRSLSQQPVDRIVIPHSRGELDSPLPESLASITSYVGPIVRDVDPSAIAPLRARYGLRPDDFLLLSTPGGGGFPEEAKEFFEIVTACHRELMPKIERLRHIVILGPRFPTAGEFPESFSASALPGMTLVHEEPDLVSLLSMATWVVSASGYNTVQEIRSNHVPAVFLPGPRTHDDPALRAEKMAQAGFAITLNDRGDAESTGRKLASIVASTETHREILRRYAWDTLIPGNRAAARCVLGQLPE